MEPEQANTPTPPPAENSPIVDESKATETKASDAEPIKQIKTKTPTGVIVFAIIIALGLAALAVITYLKSRPKPVTNTAATTQTVNPATIADIDQTSKDLDSALEAVDNTDISANDLSDASLDL